MLNKDEINSLIVTRHFYYMAELSIASTSDYHLFSVVNLLQDAVEIFLVAISRHVDAAVVVNIQFEKYFEEINKKTGKELPFKSKLIDLNKMRVNAKHYGIQPPREKCEAMMIVVREFLEETTKMIFNEDFNTVSLINLLDEGEVKNYLLDAKDQLEKNNYLDCLINCRKVLYALIEYKYNISQFKEVVKEDDIEASFKRAFCDAPDYCKNPEYIAKNVTSPTDYIIYNHTELEQKLLKYSVSTNMYFNVWRLTPCLYKFDDGDWAVKIETMNSITEENTNYVYVSTIEIALRIQDYDKKTIVRKHFYDIEIELVDEDIPVYQLADEKSEIIATIPKAIKTIDNFATVTGFDKKQYCRIHYELEDTFIIGYISMKFVKRV